MDHTYKPNQSGRTALVSGVAVVFGLYILYSIFLGGTMPQVEERFVDKAVVTLKGDSSVIGTVYFSQTSRDSPVTVSGKIEHLDATSSRGFHIHTSGDLTNGCLSTGSHFNPLGKEHGAPADSNRHVGDLGNIESDAHGVASFSFEDQVISLNGPLSILGRAVVVHAGTDDLGRGGNSDSKTTGNAGGRAACGVIGLQG